MVRHRIVLTGGGTGGHVYPALAVAEQLKLDPNVEKILYIGVSGHIEERLAKEKGLQFVGLSVAGMPRKLSINLLKWPVQMLAAVFEARKILQLFRPTAVLGTGGYASAAPLLAAGTMKVPYAIHEPDAHAGLVNRLLARNAALVSLGMEAASGALKTSCGRAVANGNPVRQSLVKPLTRDAACAVLGLNPSMKTVLIMGGSQGAQAINNAVMQCLPQLLQQDPPIQIIHQVGEKNFDAYRQQLGEELSKHPRYLLRAYFEDLSTAYAASDLTVCRAGAMTIAELSVTGTPAIFIPYPFAAADHQRHNAEYLQDRGAAIVLSQNELTAQTLQDYLVVLLQDYEQLQNMRKAMRALGKPHAAAILAEQVKNLGLKGE
jgi:UDP-N-acetylglucosamine--N-acetylmuramyl-(pentapeptide) pyrophosphoryl-undecaprenol N-acetylglucosamine transferase